MDGGWLIVAVLGAIAVLGGMGRSGFQIGGRGQPLAPHELTRRRAARAAFAGAFCVYLVQTGGWPLDQLPPWTPAVLMVAAGVSLLLVLAGVVGARERDPSGVVVSLVIAGGGYALLRWQWYVPRDYFGADYVSADLINRLLPGVYVAAAVAGLARALICLLPFGGQRQPRNPYEIARLRAVGAAFVFVFCLYVLCTGQWLGPLLGALAAWTPTALVAVAGLALPLVGTGLRDTHKFGQRDRHGVGVSLAVAAAAAVALWWRWQMPPGPAFEFVNPLLPGLYLAVLIAALVRALICAQLFGGAKRIIARLLKRRKKAPRPASSRGSGFWAEMRESFERGRAGRAWLD
jgi:hypothetical protein